MELIDSIPCIRFADVLQYEMIRWPSKTYDCRMIYALKGEAVMGLGEQSVPMTRGCLVIFQPGTQYSITPREHLTLAVFDFDYTLQYKSQTDFLAPCPADQFRPELAHQTVEFTDAPMLNRPLFMENAAFLESVIQKIVMEFQHKQLYWQSKSSALFKQLLCEVARTQQAGGDPQWLMSKILPYIDENIHRPITNRELGDRLGYNPNYLNRLMLCHTGLSLHQYVLQRRLTLARALLVTTQLPVSEIAINLGFHSASHFSGFFKKATGTTPAQFRKNGAL